MIQQCAPVDVYVSCANSMVVFLWCGEKYNNHIMQPVFFVAFNVVLL